MDGGNVLSLAESALACSWRQKKPKVCWLPDHPSYVATLPDNLLSRVELQDFEEDLRNGGGELDWRSDGRSPPKFQAAYSSSALAVNTFSPFRRRMTDLTICNLNGFKSLRFEARLPNGAGMPNLDVLCQGSTAVAIESKCVEYLRTGETAEARRHNPDVPFKPAYKDVEHLLDKQFGDLYKLINANFGAFAPVGVAQLVKHYLGIKNTIGDRPAILVYLFGNRATGTSTRCLRTIANKLIGSAACCSGRRSSSSPRAISSYGRRWRGHPRHGSPSTSLSCGGAMTSR